MIGANREALIMQKTGKNLINVKELGLETPRSGFAHSMEDAEDS